MTKTREREDCRHSMSDFYKEIKLGCVAVNGIEVWKKHKSHQIAGEKSQTKP